MLKSSGEDKSIDDILPNRLTYTHKQWVEAKAAIQKLILEAKIEELKKFRVAPLHSYPGSEIQDTLNKKIAALEQERGKV